MTIDVQTLGVLTVFVTALVGCLLVFACWQSRASRALAFWGASSLVCAASVVLFVGRGRLPDLLSVAVANALLFVCFGLFWAGFRAFEGRRAHPVLVLAGAILWLAACGVPDLYRSPGLRIALASLGSAAYYLAAAAELWRGRGERLVSRAPLIGLLTLHAAVVVSRYPIMLASGGADERTLATVPWFAFHAFEGLLFIIVAAFLLLAMAKERIELEQRMMASRDALTGVPNRRAFFERGRAILDAARRADQEAALLLLDLDHFKRINDRFGHAAGDDVLRSFARCVAGSLPPDALFARLGGEEFACLLPDAPELAARRTAERLRAAVAELRHEASGAGLHTTVSIGVATTADAGHVVEGLLAAADVTLYRAKNTGRNRVEGHRAERQAGAA